MLKIEEREVGISLAHNHPTPVNCDSCGLLVSATYYDLLFTNINYGTQVWFHFCCGRCLEEWTQKGKLGASMPDMAPLPYKDLNLFWVVENDNA